MKSHGHSQCRPQTSGRPNTGMQATGYRRAPAKALVILASLAREGSGNTRPAPDAESLDGTPEGLAEMPRV